MGNGYNVDVEQLRTHARNLEAIKDRFGAVKAASAHIAQDDQAYGLLCGWISGILEGRHAAQDDLLAFAENNLALIATELRATADEYSATEDGNAALVRSAGGDLGEAR
ncbi:excreted virulence factor EspC (type VII ESX diderm) [Saccharothrix carnea]|uniref:Excreted virulence factor EspC (Type VII ESX diderm) n=1 Tax=Saccharothrix carnea TaxID=1280637 RepID=A0A2P8IBL5_SACCR|nr:type VII secretion target [Saccharothrix carnea]PSL55847.1 excreted virulence factor EspC (type VII ESX diderm) [Saccharothrix carnea]